MCDWMRSGAADGAGDKPHLPTRMETPMTTTTVTPAVATGRSLVSTDLFVRLSARVADEASVSSAEAETITDQMLVFLKAAPTTRARCSRPARRST